MCIVCSPRMRKDATKLYAKRQISCEFTVSQCSPLCPSRKKQAPFYYRGVVIQKRRIKKKSKDENTFSYYCLFVSFSHGSNYATEPK